MNPANQNDQEWYFTHICKTRMGKYTSEIEQEFLTHAFRNSGANLTILDVGGGHGQHSIFVKGLGHDPVLLEFDPAPINIFLENQTSIPAIQASGLDLPIRDDAFDAVMTIEVGTCITGKDGNNIRFFQDVNRVLKKNGLFIFTALNKNSYINYLKKLKKDRPSYESMYYLETFTDFRRKLSSAGLRLEHCWGYRWPPFTRGSNHPLIPILGFFEKAFQLKQLIRISPWLFFVARKT